MDVERSLMLFESYVYLITLENQAISTQSVNILFAISLMVMLL